MTEVLIRKAHVYEYEEVTEVFLKSFIPEGVEQSRRERIIHRIKNAMEKNLTKYTLLELDKEIIGLGAESRFRGSSFIGYIGVIPKQRKKGYGTKIFESVFSEAKKYNKTIELFSNPGADTIYRRYGFHEEYVAHIYYLTSSSSSIITNEIEIYVSSPKWILELDKETMGFDRSKLLLFLKNQLEAEVIGIRKDGFAFCQGNNIGPVIAKNKSTFQRLVNYFTMTNEIRIILPESNENVIEVFSPNKSRFCYKMFYGEKLQQKLEWLYSINAFATS